MAAKFNNRLSSGKFGTVSARHINQTAKLQEGYVRWSKKRFLANINLEEEQNVFEKRLTRATQVCVEVRSFIF